VVRKWKINAALYLIQPWQFSRDVLGIGLLVKCLKAAMAAINKRKMLKRSILRAGMTWFSNQIGI